MRAAHCGGFALDLALALDPDLALLSEARNSKVKGKSPSPAAQAPAPFSKGLTAGMTVSFAAVAPPHCGTAAKRSDPI
ncbi:MAG: hypothetical protein H7Y19_00955 [Luteimonas sp.]|nr:hypothetical protein [Luteimonas sp.]